MREERRKKTRDASTGKIEEKTKQQRKRILLYIHYQTHSLSLLIKINDITNTDYFLFLSDRDHRLS
jgi:hypothetical protein